MDWLRKLLHPDSAPARTMRLDAGYARQVAILHHQGGFARGWEPAECAALIAETSVAADGVFGKGSDPAGFVMSRKAADEAEILSIVVAPANRRDGLGRILLSAHLARLAEDGVARVFLEVEEGNLAAERLYRHFGFREVGRRKGYYPKADGSRATAIAMRLDLT
ncbi:GNAT family N-acetyltransferase [Bosea sp. F3-2]|jgi:ribosomal-protein-alanine N-acetyltransferase|uniref:GNAT family N-acetyltransferase n=1 Tax=Bosea sp. F3-2 TaxID=2599640 RepID=UPI0011EC7B31|nr:GNAT family N-acetyltransferase [Bosea sp. F3-2]QEL24537.1 GNAT family N-acetyltransferase [Bosea sp. F3-2]